MNGCSFSFAVRPQDMYIDILLTFVFIISTYTLWRRVARKIPDLALIPEQDISILLEENTAKLQRFFLHLFHFRFFYHKRHYHERLRLFFTKLLCKVHIFLLRIDNGIMRLMKWMRAGNEMEIEQRHIAREYFAELGQGQLSSSSAAMQSHPVQEIRTAKRIGLTAVSRLSRTKKADVTLANDNKKLSH